MRSPLRTLVPLVLCGLLLSAASCQLQPIDTDGTTAPSRPDRPAKTTPARAEGGENYQAELETLQVAAWHSMSGYSRAKFPHWRDQGEECDTRETVLKRDAGSFKTGEDCKVVSGRWVSVYDGKEITEPRDLDIDHMVPLANAWRTGAWDWTKEQRTEFANDLTRPQLLAVTATTNRSKGDQDPSEWRPPLRSYWCEYAQDWVTVKFHWKLAVTAAEKAALREMLDTC